MGSYQRKDYPCASRASDRNALGAIMLVCRMSRENIKISSYICINELRVERY